MARSRACNTSFRCLPVTLSLSQNALWFTHLLSAGWPDLHVNSVLCCWPCRPGSMAASLAWGGTRAEGGTRVAAVTGVEAETTSLKSAWKTCLKMSK